jgi:hypothetical protein
MIGTRCSARTPRHSLLRTEPRDEALRSAQTCYDCFAGRLGVAITHALVARGHIELDQDSGTVMDDGQVFLRKFVVMVTQTKRAGRLFCRPCLDWRERRAHPAGKLGAAIARRCFALGRARRLDGTRAVALTPGGGRSLREMFGIGPLSR